MTKDILLKSLWDDTHAATLDEPGKLLYRSNLLGSDLRITNFGGGNTSAKVAAKDPLTGTDVQVLWVKGSGGDIGSMKLDGFATLYMDRLMQLRAQYRGLDQEDAMVEALGHCIWNLNPRAPSIDTWLHGFVPRAHVDHVHSDAVIAIAACADQVRLTQEIFGGALGYLPWQRPGIDLGIQLGRMAEENPGLKGVVLGQHGLFTWADTAKDCYLLTLEMINKAAVWLEANVKRPVFGGERVPALAPEARRAAARRLMPLIRGRIGGAEAKSGHFTDAPEVLEFVNSGALDRLAPMGTSCPDHFLRTKIKPLVVPADADEAALDALLAGFGPRYGGDFVGWKHPESGTRGDLGAGRFLVPRMGMLSFAKDKATARISAEFYLNAINVMRGASGVSTYQGLPEKEAFDIEYWLLEEAKLQRMPKPKAMQGRVAFITGGAGGIGSASAERLMREGCNVVLADIDQAALDAVVAGFGQRYGRDMVRGVAMDVTSEAQVIAALEFTVAEYGGLDVLVNNAGITSAAAVEDTTLAMWTRTMDILSTGYFLVAREGYRILKAQGLGGSMIFIASKNGVAASPGASAYCTAKAAEIHLARCMALEGAPMGIRVNVVNPDAVLRGSKIWQGEWSQQRAASNKIAVSDLEEHYRKRSLLQRSVFPEDIAEGVYFFASDLSAKSTGNFLNVDAGNAVSFTR